MGGVDVLAAASGLPVRASRVLEPAVHVTHIVYVMLQAALYRLLSFTEQNLKSVL